MFTAAGCLENLNLEISRRRLADYVKEMRAAREARSMIFPISTYHIIDLWRFRSRCCLTF